MSDVEPTEDEWASQQTQGVESMLVYRWSTVEDGGSALNQH